MCSFDLKLLQKTELMILKDVVDFCKKNDIRYVIESGTMLGAVRHKGFIPWDDDIDICMDKKNYKKFLKLATKQLPKKYFLQNYRTEHKTVYRWSKVRLNGSKVIEPSSYNIHNGVFIDIFVVTGLSSSKFLRGIQIKAFNLYKKFLNKYYVKEKNIPVNSRFWKLAYKIPEFLRLGILKALEKVWLRNLGNKSECFHSGDCKSYPAKFFNESSKYVFENAEYWGPKDYENYLTAMYGDWRKIPEETERIGHSLLYVDLGEYGK